MKSYSIFALSLFVFIITININLTNVIAQPPPQQTTINQAIKNKIDHIFNSYIEMLTTTSYDTQQPNHQLPNIMKRFISITFVSLYGIYNGNEKINDNDYSVSLNIYRQYYYKEKNIANFKHWFITCFNLVPDNIPNNMLLISEKWFSVLQHNYGQFGFKTHKIYDNDNDDNIITEWYYDQNVIEINEAAEKDADEHKNYFKMIQNFRQNMAKYDDKMKCPESDNLYRRKVELLKTILPAFKITWEIWDQYGKVCLFVCQFSLIVYY